MPKECCKEMWGRIPEDEPVFTLRAQDSLAPVAVLNWVEWAIAYHVNQDKINRARQHAIDMLEWQNENPTRVKLPD